MTWKEYQEEAAEFFRSLGLDALTDATVQGVRTSHDIDVLVKSHHVGFDVTWIVECKKWNTKVSKLHVLALREIVSDIGADRGILLSESGFQSGAIEAANLTNVEVTSLSLARAKSEHDINAMRLRELYDRKEVCKEKYWDIPKCTRIEYGLRPDTGESGYSGTVVISAVEELLSKALREKYPFDVDPLTHLSSSAIPESISSATEVIGIVEPIITELESKIEMVRSVHSQRERCGFRWSPHPT